MLSKSVSSFIEATASDRKLQAEWNEAASPDALVGVASRHGYEFDVKELELALEAMQRLQGGELGEAEMGQVAGGLGTAQTLSLSSSLTKGSFQFYEGWPCKWIG